MLRHPFWFALVWLIPLALNPLSRWRFEPDKAALLLLLASVLVGGGLRLPRRRVALPLLIYIVLLALASAFSVAPAYSVWGAPGWRAGLLTWLACALVFLAAMAQVHTDDARRRVLDALLAGSGVVCAVGLLQAVNLDPLAALTGVGPRLYATFGHANFFAAYLALTAPLALGRALAAETPRARVRWGALLAAQAVCMALTLSRSGWLGLATGLGVVALTAVWRAGRKRWVAAALLGGSAALAALLALSALPALPGDAPHLLQTVTSVFRTGSPTVQVRFLGWGAAARMAADRPALGFGPGTFGLALDAYFPPALALFGGARALGGRPHSLLLDVAASAGVPALAAYGGMVATVLWGMAQRAADGIGREGIEWAAVLAAALGSVVTSILEFETVTVVALFWLLAGLSEARAAPGRAVRLPGYARVALVGGAAICALVIVVPDLAAGLAGRTPPDQAAALIAWAARAAPTPGEYADLAGQYHAQAGQWDAGEALYRDLIAASPPAAQARLWRALGDFGVRRAWHDLGAPGQRAAHFAAAVDAYTRALQGIPTDPDLWLDRGTVYLELGQPAAARADFEAAAALAPDYERAVRAMGEYGLAAGDHEAARAAFARAEALRAAWALYLWQR